MAPSSQSRASSSFAQSFPAGASAPTVVLVRDREKLASALAAARSAEGVAQSAGRSAESAGARFEVTLTSDPFGEKAFGLHTQELRAELRAAAEQSVLVGGPTAEEADLREAIERDTKLLVPLVLLVVLTILILLLRSLVAPLMLIASVVLSFFAALGREPSSSSSSSPTFRERIRAIRSSRSSSSSPSASTTTSSSWHASARRRSSFRRARRC